MTHSPKPGLLGWQRRTWLVTASAALAAALFSAGCTHSPAMADAQAYPPIVFVHGNGDTAALWTTTLWRFESNGWPRERLHAIHLPYPSSRGSDDKPEAGRTSTTEHRQYLAGEIDKLLAATGAKQVVLIANSRGGNAVRSYAQMGGAAKVSHAILGGTPNHGVQVNPDANPGNEFNGAGPFLTGLNNQGAPGVEVTPGPRWMTIRSDNNDKFAQPEGTWIGAKGKPTGVTFAGPELAGAKNVVIAGIDHRETSYSPQAFAAAYEFITGKAPATTGFTPEARVVLDGQLSGLGLNNEVGGGNFVNNLPLVGGTVEIYATDAKTGERLGDARLRKTVGADGRWGPFVADGKATYEFVISAPGFATSHTYREPFPRSSNIVNLRAERLADADKSAGAVVSFFRPRGYFGLPRDRIVFDGKDPAPGVPTGVAGLAVSKIKLDAGPSRTVVGRFNDQTIAGRSWPAAENHVVTLELH